MRNDVTFRVVNLRTEQADIRVCRPSAWGNPWRIQHVECPPHYSVSRSGHISAISQIKREAHLFAVQEYRSWILERPELVTALLTRISDLCDNAQEVTLGCWCVPLPCHATVLAELLAGRLTTKGEQDGKARRKKKGRRRNKHNAKPTIYRGQRYDSQGEARYARDLDLLLAAGKIASWCRPKPIMLINGPTRDRRVTYKPDFFVVDNGGKEEWIDVKGMVTQAFRIKALLWADKYPERRLRVVNLDGSTHKLSWLPGEG